MSKDTLQNTAEEATSIKATHAEERDDVHGDHGRDLSRIIGLSDGVFGFALTLLATNIHDIALPHNVDSAVLGQAIIGLLPQFLVYAATFYFIIIKWMVHRRIFAVVEQYDSRLIWINSLFLLMIAFMPVPSRLLMDYSHLAPAVAFFAAAHALTTVIQEALWAYITHTPRLMRPNVDADYIRHSNIGNIIFIAVLVVSVFIALFINPQLAIASWLLISITNNYAERVNRRKKQHEHDRSTAQ